MRVDCYNACECPVIDIQYGDTFYHDSDLYIKVNSGGLFTDRNDVCFAVQLSTGSLCVMSDSCEVIKADARVVANTVLES